MSFSKVRHTYLLWIHNEITFTQKDEKTLFISMIMTYKGHLSTSL